MTEDRRRGHVGESVLRVEDDRLLRGWGCYLDDVPSPKGTVHLGFLRSPHAHALVKSIDDAAARALPGVIDVLGGADIAAIVPPFQADFENPGFQITKRPVVATDRVRFVGDTVAVVLAESPYVLEDALELISVDYDPQPAVVDPEDALAPGAPRVHDDIEDNILYCGEFKTDGFDDIFAAADHVFEARFQTSRVAVVSMEPRGCLAVYDRGQESLTFWSSNQVPHILRTALCELIGWPDTKTRVIAPDVGGGFGMKAYIYPEELVAASLAIKRHGAYKWIQDRQDDFLTSNHAREQTYDLSYAVDTAGVIQAIKADVNVNVGAYASYPLGSSLEANGGPRNLPGAYKFSHFAYRTCAVATHTCPTGAFRGVSAPSAFFAAEGMIERIARTLGLDSVEVRRRNLINPEDFPYTNAMGQVYDTGSHVECLDRALAMADYADYRRTQPASRKVDGKYCGIGVATVTEQTGQGASRYKERGLYRIPGFDSALVKVEPSGKCIAYISQATQGQGHLTAYAQIIAGQLGLNVDDVTVVEGDTAVVPYGSGTFASRGAILGGGAAIKACTKIRKKIQRIAAHLLEASASDIVLEDGQAHVSGVPQLRVSISDVAAVAHSIDTRLIPKGEEHGLEALEHYDPPTATVSNSAHVACVAVDAVTGKIEVERYVVVHDCGRVINPLLVEGQIQGAVANGLGQVLFEGIVYDARGQLLTTNLMDYELPTMLDVPDMEIDHIETPSKFTLGGFKGVGEGGVIGAVPALANAVYDALAPLQASINRLPLHPSDIMRLIPADPTE